VSYALTLVLAVFAAGFMIRIFIIMHDCGHGSFLKSQRASNALGTVCGFLALTPYFQWRHNHALHHAHSGNLSKRLQWDLPMTLTVREFAALSEWRKLLYRVYRHPLVMFVFLPPLLFFFGQRLGSPGNGKRERESVILTNVVLAALVVGLGMWIGFKEVLLIQASYGDGPVGCGCSFSISTAF
jgi:omega-6 fatty acid desaturase (delta-12 desaturase)